MNDESLPDIVEQPNGWWRAHFPDGSVGLYATCSAAWDALDKYEAEHDES